MTVLAVKTYCAQLLVNVDVPAPVTTFIQEFKQTEVGSNIVCWISDPRHREKRLATGMKQVDHELTFVLEWTVADEQLGGTAWDVFLAKFDSIFRALKPLTPIAITDPETGDQSALEFIGDNIDTDELETKLDEALQGMVVFSAVKVLRFSEMFFPG